MSQVIVFGALAFSIVIAIFAVQNTTPVGVQFLTFRADTVAVSVLVLISALLGAAVMLLLGVGREVSAGLRQRALTQQLKIALERIEQLEAAKPNAAPATPAISSQPSAVSSQPPDSPTSATPSVPGATGTDT